MTCPQLLIQLFVPIVENDNRVPIAGALVSLDSTSEVRTGGEGRFIFREVKTGTRHLLVRSIGAEPLSVSVQVLPGETTMVTLTLRKVVTLGPVAVSAPTWNRAIRRDLAERQRLGLGYFRDSLAVERLPHTAAIFDGVSGVRVQRGVGNRFRILTSGGCELAVWINRHRSEGMDLYLLNPKDIAVVEVYPRESIIPLEFQVRRACGAMVVWTKSFLG